MSVHRSKFGYLKPDFVECIRNVNAINAYATGVIFPYSEEEKECSEEDGKCSEEDAKIYMHSISEYNKLTSFYSIPIYIPLPNSRADKIKSWEEWQQKMDDCITDQMKNLNNIIKKGEVKFNSL